jgi:hypothetical protein
MNADEEFLDRNPKANLVISQLGHGVSPKYNSRIRHYPSEKDLQL